VSSGRQRQASMALNGSHQTTGGEHFQNLLGVYTGLLEDAQHHVVTSNILPSISLMEQQVFFSNLEQELHADQQMRDTRHALDTCHNEGASGVHARSAFDTAIVVQSAAQESTMEPCISILEAMRYHFEGLDDSDSEWEKTLNLCCIIKCGTPGRLALYASQGSPHIDRLEYLLSRDDFGRKAILEAGGPKKQNYGNMLDIYADIQARSKRACRSEEGVGREKFSILQRLALAVALEFADPIHTFDSPDTYIDPVERYLHYETAYLEGELDSLFPTLSTWELRMVVNSDASNEELTWCRLMMRNYRPDHIFNPDYGWRYCGIVRSDVRYKAPVWETRPKTYKQLISGGGKCGPRAWFGRFACKSFGIPTWGVRQPGHAAMSRWMPLPNKDNYKSPMTYAYPFTLSLGGPCWVKSWWEDRNGTDFLLEATARAQSSITGSGGYDNALRLEWIAMTQNEPKIGSQTSRYCRRDVRQRLWSELATIQKEALCKGIGSTGTPRSVKEDGDGDAAIMTQADELKNQKPLKEGGGVFDESSNTITMPVSCRCSSLKENGKVIFMRSFLGTGEQVHLCEDGSLEFEVMIPPSISTNEITLNLSARIVTIHKDHDPVQISLRSVDSGQVKKYNMEIPYTAGDWNTTPAVKIRLHPGVMYKMTVERSSAKALGLTIKDFALSLVL
jgi:hypothetical protein